MKTKNIRLDIFTNQMIAHGNRVQAYQAAYPGALVATATTNASKLMKDPHMSHAVNEDIVAVRSETFTTMKEVYADRMLNIHQKLTYPEKLVGGEVVLPRKLRRKGVEHLDYRMDTVPQMLTTVVMCYKS